MVELEVMNGVFYHVNLLSPVQGVLHNNLAPWSVKGASFSEYFMIFPWRGAYKLLIRSSPMTIKS